jgi:hypothetical protein
MERMPDARTWDKLRRALLIAGLLAVVVAINVACGFCSDLHFLLIREGMTQAQVEALLGKPEYGDSMGSFSTPGPGQVGADGSGSFYSPRWPIGRELIVEWDTNGRVRKTILLP